MSRSVRVNTNSCVSGPQYSPRCGPRVVRARVGFKPTMPHIDAGKRIEPPMSFPCATGTMPAATAAAEPPLEPPVLRSRSHGLRVAPYASGSVVQLLASSGVLVLPTNTNPAARKRAASQVSSGAVQPASFSARMPQWYGSPAVWHTASFTRNGTPRKGPDAACPASSCARSERSWITALSWGLTLATRSMAASTSSVGDTAPDATSSACAVASACARSVTVRPGCARRSTRSRRRGLHLGSSR